MRSDSSGSKAEKLCFECHNSEHLARKCPNHLCYSVRGHRSYNCPKANLKDRGYKRSGRSPDYRRMATLGRTTKGLLIVGPMSMPVESLVIEAPGIEITND